MEGYPEKNVPFTLLQMMDIGLRLILQAMETNSLVLLVMSLLWEDGSKGVLPAGLVNPVNDTQADTEREGMITKEMLEEYGCENLYLKNWTDSNG